MKIKLLFAFIVFFSIYTLKAQTTITENFETGLPTSAPSSETSVTLSSGI